MNNIKNNNIENITGSLRSHHIQAAFSNCPQGEFLRRLCELAADRCGRAYLVGGALRDYALNGKIALDLDFSITDVNAGQLARHFADAIDGRYVLLDEAFGIHRVIVTLQEPQQRQTVIFDISDALENSIERDLARRDLTFNAMVFDPLTGRIFDPYQGAADLAARRIRMISAANLVDDPLRMLRVFRFYAQLTESETHLPDLDWETLSVIQQEKALIQRVAGERIHMEFLKLLSCRYSFPALLCMAESGFLEEILPEMIATRQVPANAYHHLNLFDHTLELVHQAEIFIESFPESSRQHIFSEFKPYLTRFGLIKLACLLHDVGKPATMVQTVTSGSESGKLTFYGHDKLSENMTDDIGRRWRLGNDILGYVKKLVRWHLYPCQFGKNSPRKSNLRFFRRIGPETPDLLLLALADRMSAQGPEILPEMLEASIQNHFWLLNQYYIEQPVLTLPRLLTGHDVMDVLGIPAGPKIKEILEKVQEAHQIGEISTPEEARQWIKTL